MEGENETAPVPKIGNRNDYNGVLNTNTNKTVNPIPKITVEDETHLLYKDTTDIPRTPERTRAPTPDPLGEFTPEELEITTKVMRAMSRKRKEVEMAAAREPRSGPTTPFVINLEGQFDQAGPQPNTRLPPQEAVIPSERQVTRTTFGGESESYRHEASSGPSRHMARTIVRPRTSPFTQEVLNQQMEKIKMSSCTYDGKGDPKRYIPAFESHMLLYTDTNAVWCKVFPTTLVGAASDWFTNLQPGSIGCFDALVKLFMGQYISNSARQRTSGELMSVRQRKDESLRDFVRRFNNEANTIPKLQQEIALMALMNGLADSDFKKYMARKSFLNLGAAFNKAHEYIKSEEMLKASNQITSAEPSRRQNTYMSPKTPGGVNRQNQQKANRPARGLWRYSNYTQLNTPRAAIYSINQHKEDWNQPTPMIKKGRDVKKYCMFHRDVGHYTEECVQLKENIEDLIQKGHLSQYRSQGSSEIYRQGSAPAGRKLTIEVITGGPVHGGSVSGAKKILSEYKHIVNALGVDERPRPTNIPSVSFSEADAKGIVFPHDDPLVLILLINGCDIKRALIDGGSSTNILFARVFDAMMIGRKYLTPVAYPVIGFNGSTVRPEGSIIPQVRIGEGTRARDMMTEFLIVDVPSAYNAIVGRPLIHDAQAVVSTYHLTMVYVSNAGRMERVRGSQRWQGNVMCRH
ncbi:uncharacterized protein LOC110708948 [Chenopodium quinoa]|uniref:uncharacterized protein LOC110708948 n=1 Tax=Chenopodium quinoa TaxID=63459 RepID=UPI000B7780B7|nr:uncharacterized protein LOC110708948 [Chenopodium quinoa]